MATLTIKNQQGADAGQIELSAAVFEAEQNAVLVREVYNAYMANQRQGTHSTRTRGMVRGGGKKPWKQKGTGRARAGSNRSPLWRGGAIIFGPSPRDYREKVNRQKRRGAYRALLSAKREAGEILVVDSLDFSASPKTREAAALIERLGLKGRKTLFVTKEKNEALVRAVRNLAGSGETPARTAVAGAISIFDLLTSDTLVITREAIEALQERLES